MRINDTQIMNSKPKFASLFTNSNYFMGVYFFTLKDRYVRNPISIKDILFEIEETFPVLKGKDYHYMRSQEMVVIHDRDDANLKLAVEACQNDRKNKQPSFGFVAPSSGNRDPLERFNMCDSVDYRPDEHDKYTSVRLAKHVREPRYNVWMIDVCPEFGMNTVIIDGVIAIDFAKPVVLKSDDEQSED